MLLRRPAEICRHRPCRTQVTFQLCRASCTYHKGSEPLAGLPGPSPPDSTLRLQPPFTRSPHCQLGPASGSHSTSPGTSWNLPPLPHPHRSSQGTLLSPPALG